MSSRSAVAYSNPVSAESGNFRPLGAQVSPGHSRQPMLSSPAFQKGRVKWSSSKKPFCYLTMADGRDVFLHRDDFQGDWPPPYYKSLKFELLETGHKICPRRAKHAELIGDGR